jgi:hypothetical protein
MLSNKRFKKLYIIIGVHVQYRGTIMNQLNIHGFYKIF